ncbi:MAG: hypothetical protein V8S89_03730 [Oscillospiraceae bacterium]
MNFSQTLNGFIARLDCTASELCTAAGLSPATISRYRAGERVPDVQSATFSALCDAIANLSQQRAAERRSRHNRCGRRSYPARRSLPPAPSQLGEHLDTLIRVLQLPVARICQATNYDASTLSRFRSGARQPADPAQFAASVARFAVGQARDAASRGVLATLLGCSVQSLEDNAAACALLQGWLLGADQGQQASVCAFLEKLDGFDLNEYIRAIHFDEIKVPTIPFQLPTARTYTGLSEMMTSELDFLKATVLSKSQAPVIMYSDMPMEEMAKDPEFPKKWMYGMALMLKKGLQLYQIHNLDRSFDDMMLGLESWIPMYMTGQIAPYYLKGVQNNVFSHLLKVSGAAALAGEAIVGQHSAGRYTLTKQRDDIAYYTRRAEALLAQAQPLMEIYRAERAAALQAFLLADAQTPGPWAHICASLPLYTFEPDVLQAFLAKRALAPEAAAQILDHAAAQRVLIERQLAHGAVTDTVPLLSPEEFVKAPMLLALSGLFYETDIPYTYEEYQMHLAQTERFAAAHPGYTLRQSSRLPFRNLQILLRPGQWAMVSKHKSPAIHFVIRHPKLRAAMEQFAPPIYEDDSE